MKNKLLHTPEGVRDIHNIECAKKLLLQDKLSNLLKIYGFKDVQTPTFEFFDVFTQENGTINANEMYKFFDRDGNTLVLRPDITPSIARFAATYYKEESLPIRLCYVGNTFINKVSYQGKLKETTQLGAELINDGSLDADAELLALTIECMLKAGLTHFQVDLGQVEFFQGLIEEAGFMQEEEIKLRMLIEDKNFFGVEELISGKNISEELKNVFLKLPELFGTIEKLHIAKELTKNERALKAIYRLEKIYEMLTYYGLEKYITFDLGMLSEHNYYTGIIFRAYTFGNGDAIVRGGRYDNLVKQFGKDSPAVGLVIIIDELISALFRQKINVELNDSNTLLLYEQSQKKTAVLLANHFRKDEINIELLSRDSSKELEDYIQYGKRKNIGGILYIENDEGIHVINIETNESTKSKLTDYINPSESEV